MKEMKCLYTCNGKQNIVKSSINSGPLLGKLAMKYAQRKEVMILMVVSFLLVMLIYSSVTTFDAFARKKITTLNTCYKSTPDKPGATSADICCTMFYSNGKLSSSLCQKCNYDSDGNKIDCRNYSARAGELGSITPPPSAGLLNARGTGAFNDTTTGNTTNLGNVGNTVQQQPQQQQQLQTTTCPNDSTPDAKGNCPSSAGSSNSKTTLIRLKQSRKVERGIRIEK